MTLKAVLEKSDYEGLSETERGLYKEVDGKYALDITGVQIHPDVTGLQNNRDALLEEKKTQKERHEREMEELQNKLKARDEAERKIKEEGGHFKELYESERKARQEETEKLRRDKEDLMGKMDGAAIEQRAKDLAVKLGGPDYADGLLPHIKPRLKVAEIDGERAVRVADAAGNITSMTLDDLTTELKGCAHLKPLIRGPGSTGGGSGPANGGGGGSTTGDFDKYFDPASNDWNLTRQGQLYRSDREQYDKLKNKYGEK